jgi:hypothetical protein
MHHELISPGDQPGAKVNKENPASIFLPLKLGQAGALRLAGAWGTEIARQLKSGGGEELAVSLSPESRADLKTTSLLRLRWQHSFSYRRPV